MAAKFLPSSMEWMRNFGGDPLTMVSEMPLFACPGIGETLGPPDPVLEKWREIISEWKAKLQQDEEAESVRQEIEKEAIKAMPVKDQQYFQWQMICQGLNIAK